MLDVGCNDGETLVHAAKLGVRTLRGVDINPQAVGKANDSLKRLPDAIAIHASGDDLPFSNATFDVVICLEVLEHIPAELRLAAINEMWRVLKPDGQLILSVPFRGLSAVLDPENMRFHFPWLYAQVNRFIGGQGKETGYIGQKHGVVFHHHFTHRELLELLSPRFNIDGLHGRGFVLFPLGAWVRWPFYRRHTRQNFICRFAEWLMALEMHLPIPKALAFDVLLRASRV